MTDLKPEDLAHETPVNARSVSRPFRLGGFATGNYMCHCLTCKGEFTGDKRAISCLPCAAEKATSLLADRARMEKALREIENEHGAVQPVGAGDGSTFIVNDHVAARNMRKIAREGLGVSQ